MDTLLLIVIGVFGLFALGWTMWVLAQAFFGLIAINFAGPGGRRADGPKTGHALTFILDHLNRADQFDQISCSKISFRL